MKTTISQKLLLEKIRNREDIGNVLRIDQWDNVDFKKVTGMGIATAVDQGETGAQAFEKYFAWDSKEHCTQL